MVKETEKEAERVTFLVQHHPSPAPFNHSLNGDFDSQFVLWPSSSLQQHILKIMVTQQRSDLLRPSLSFASLISLENIESGKSKLQLYRLWYKY